MGLLTSGCQGWLRVVRKGVLCMSDFGSEGGVVALSQVGGCGAIVSSGVYGI